MSIGLDDGFFMKKYNLVISGFREFCDLSEGQHLMKSQNP